MNNLKTQRVRQREANNVAIYWGVELGRHYLGPAMATLHLTSKFEEWHN
jgi:hypothetical protein